MYDVRFNATAPQGLLLACLLLMLAILSQNVMISTLAPQYVMFGSQRACNSSDLADCAVGPTNASSSVDLVLCSLATSANTTEGPCMASSLSLLMTRVSLNSPVFGLLFVVFSWLLLLVFVVALVWAIFASRQSQTMSLSEVDATLQLLPASGIEVDEL